MPSVLALDFETANYSRSSACALAVVRLKAWQIKASESWLIRPPTPDFIFSTLHGIEWAHVKDKPHWGKLWPKLSPHFEGVQYLAAHNAPFDKGVLRAACEEYGLEAPQIKFIDTVKVAREVWGIYPTKLNLVCERLGIELRHHEALSDARACAEILVRAKAEGWEPS